MKKDLGLKQIPCIFYLYNSYAMLPNRFLNYAGIAALLIYIIAAYHCLGYYHPDEHYQLIEFAGLKTGDNKQVDLAWEYNAQIRPALQPYICLGIFRVLALINITDPYMCAFALRLVTAILAVLIIRKFIQSQLPAFDIKQQYSFILLSYFLWFMPYLNTRFSSEIWAGLSFLLGATIISKDKKGYFLAGCLMGLAFLFRFQTALMAAGLCAWLLLIRRIKLLQFVQLFAGIFIVLIAGIITDRLYYGHTVYSFLNYFNVNILEDVASDYGTAPWFYYIKYIYSSAHFLLGAVILLSLLMIIFLQPRNMFIWIVLPFLLVHSLIPHKEGRFLFPVVYYLPVILMQAFSYSPRYVWGLYLLLLIPVNLIAMAAISMKPAGNGRKAISRYIHERYGDSCIDMTYTGYSNPYDTWPGLKENFYKEKCISDKEISLNRSFVLRKKDSSAVELLVVRKWEPDQQMMTAQLKYAGWEIEKEGIPDWIQALQLYYHGPDREESLVLYKRSFLY